MLAFVITSFPSDPSRRHWNHQIWIYEPMWGSSPRPLHFHIIH